MNSFKSVFPSKRIMNKILFEMDSPWSSHKLLPLFQELYTSRTLKPTKLTTNPQVIFTMNRFLEGYRQRTNQQHLAIRDMQDWLLRQAAHLGNNNAISLLCFNILTGNEDITEQQKAQGLLNELIKLNCPLSIKIIGDLSNLTGNYAIAKKWYIKYLYLVNPNTPMEFNWKYETMEKLGEIQLRDGEINKAELNFLQVIKNCSLIESVKSYFLLSQIYGKFEPLKSKILLEQCCTQGFKESFKEIGYLELQYFNNIEKAKIWFKLGMELRDLTCFLGYFECCLKQSNWGDASICIRSLEKLSKSNANNMNFYQTFIDNYKDSIEMIENKKKILGYKE